MYTLMPLLQNAGQNLDLKIANKYFENVKKIKVLGNDSKNLH
jgi:hypothetical protein